MKIVHSAVDWEYIIIQRIPVILSHNKYYLFLGPLKDFTFFHTGCFRCVECTSKLTLKTYYNNQHSSEDKEVYCSQHVPKIGPGKFDGESIGIKAAINAPKSSTFVNEQIRPGGKASIDADALGIRSQIQQQKASHSNGSTNNQPQVEETSNRRYVYLPKINDNTTTEMNKNTITFLISIFWPS